MQRTKVTYIVSDIDKALAFEWIAVTLSRHIDLYFILIGKKDTALQSFLKQRGIRHHIVADSEYASRLTISVQVYQRLRSERPDVVHTHMWRAATIGIPVAWLLSVRTRIFTRHHALIHYREHPSGRKWDLLLNRLATHIVAISENVREILVTRDGAHEGKIHVIRHGFDLSYFTQANPTQTTALRLRRNLIDKNYPVIGIIARYVTWKGIQFAIEAFKGLLKKYPSAHLILANASGGDAMHVKSLLATLPQDSFTEIVFEENLAALYALFDVYVHVPIDRESEAFGQTYVEALAAGIPSIFTLSGVALDFIRDGRNALVVPYKNAAAIQSAIERLLGDKLLCAALISQGKTDVSKEFSLDMMMCKLEDLYVKSAQHG